MCEICLVALTTFAIFFVQLRKAAMILLDQSGEAFVYMYSNH